MVRDEIRENFPYKVMHEPNCEADDVIAKLALETQEFGKHEPVMIISADHDFIQLHKYDNIKQYSPMLKKFVKDKNPRLYSMTHIFKGDGGDGVPNVLSDDNVFVDDRRQTPVTKKKLDVWLEAEDLQKVMGDTIYRNYLRNKKMIDLTETPDAIKEQIINSFENQDPKKNKGKVFPYLVRKRCKRLVECVQEFI